MTSARIDMLNELADEADKLCAEVAAGSISGLQIWVCRQYATMEPGSKPNAKVRRIEKLIKFYNEIFKEVAFINGELPDGDPDLIWKD